MPNIKSAKKRVNVIATKTELNKAKKSALKTAVKKAELSLAEGAENSAEVVRAAIKNIDKGIFPQAFCKIIPDILGGDPEYCNIMHADGAGTKSSLAYMYWKETGDISVWKGIANAQCGTRSGGVSGMGL